MLLRREAFLQTASEIMFIHALRHESNKGGGMCCSSLLKLSFLPGSMEVKQILILQLWTKNINNRPTTKSSSCSAYAPEQVQNYPFHLPQQHKDTYLAVLGF